MDKIERIIWASSFFLTEGLPEELLEREDNEGIDEFIESHVLEAFEDWTIEDLYNGMESLAGHLPESL